ncbi:intracellular protein transport protein USO1 [Manduca sexta]|uniref:intracellular protein transport protein USO1 n=1 Tax=Manduca sexta TaxID=7130 RepID=UPI00118426E6|nr:intracellular protein transport protein USO1 [Manduca sexta]
MRVTTLATLLVLQCSVLCLAIRVPVAWNNGEVPKDNAGANNEVSVETFTPEDAQKPVPDEYFQYTAKKPQFAVEIAAAHGVQSPENHYKAYPIRPHTGVEKPKLGAHHILQEDKQVFQPLQAYVKNERHATPVSSNYEVFHPYKAEEPALQAIYKDPVLTKIRSDLENSKNRLQNYEQEAGKPDITKDEYRERPEQTDKKLFSHKNIPAEFEIHRPQRKPVYYRPVVKYNQRDQVLNQRFKHPWHQNYVKIRPVHYRPLKNHIHNLRQNHAAKYDDERNEYPQIQVSQKNVDPDDGYDIYEAGKQKYVQLRNNLDESINKAVLENRPIVQQKLELQNDDTKEDDDDEENEDEFIPIKNYAQVRKTETVKHLPRAAAFKDADTYEEIQNAPRLREAVKSTKAQTVYTEEGYEDSAYDHAGEQKHASDHEGHSGYLKQKEISGGKYKIPSLSAGFTDAGGSEYKDQVQHGKKWKENNKDNQEEMESEDYSEDEHEQTITADTYNDENKEVNRNKRENDIKNDTQLNVEKNFKNKNPNFKVPEINLNSTFLTEDEILSIAQEKKIEPKKDNLKEKYPYYFKNIKFINKHSPLRYAENFKLIPKKSKGGTEFYDSRDMVECPEVGEVNPLPEKLKNGENPTKDDDDDDEETQSKGEESFDNAKKQPRLRGLGDKIDCFKAKYFGENPLDNPFFKEEIIANPEPVTLPSSQIYKLQDTIEQNAQESQSSKVIEVGDNLSNQSETNIFILLDKLRTDNNNLHDADLKANEELKLSLKPEQNYSLNATTESVLESNIYDDVLDNIKKSKELHFDQENKKLPEITATIQNHTANSNVTYNFFQDKKDIMKSSRKKRATPFIYEPYKIIRETQNEASKKTNTLSNISPLIKQMQTRKVVDRVTRANQEPSTRQSNGRTYKDIGRNDRSKGTEKVNEDNSDISFVDVNADKRQAEPLYEVKPANHKSEYTPVENKRAMTVEDYKSQTNNNKNEQNISRAPIHIRRNSRQRRPVLDVSRYLPIPTDVQNVAESNAVKKSVTTTTEASVLQITTQPTQKAEDSSEEVSSEEEYEEYEDEEEDTPSTSSSTTTTTTTTTTHRPPPRRRRPTTTTTTSTTTTTTQKPIQEKIENFEPPKLRLITRFRNYNQEQRAEQLTATERPVREKSHTVIEDDSVSVPKYREKKKKSSKSTIVTDTKKYGDDFDDMKKEEVDALIGVKHNMDEYKPEYEKEEEEREKNKSGSSEESDEDFISSEEIDDDEDDEDEDEDEEEDGEDEEKNQELKPKVTTPEPTKRTLIRTTDAPKPTIASRTTKPQEVKPIVSRKKVEIHKELPINRASPHISQFKQDIKEEEVIKEMPPSPRRNPHKSIEVLDLYKDDSLAKEINKLDDVEVFKEDLDLKNGPRHGGNYRSAEEPTSTTPRTSRRKVPKDAEASQSENTKHVELDTHPPRRLHGGNLKSVSDIPRSRNKGRNAKLIELSDATDPPPRPMHGGNLRYDNKPKRGRGRSEKLIELDEEHHDDSTSRERNNRNYGHSRTGHAMHGGNYRSEKLVDKSADSEFDIRARKDKDVRRNAALLLNSFAQAVPLLTTTPAYILDPSKRMYYYVET